MRSGPDIPMAGESSRDGSGGYLGKESSLRDNFGDKIPSNGQTFDINLTAGTLFDFNKWESDIYNDDFFKDVKDLIEDNQKILENIFYGGVTSFTIYGNISIIGALIIAGTSAPLSLTLLGAVAIPSLFLNSYFLGTALTGQFNSNNYLLSSFVYSPIKLTAYTISTLYGLNHISSINNAKIAGAFEIGVKFAPNKYLPDYLKDLENKPSLKTLMSNLP